MAIKSDILAQKLARPRRQPRPGPVISDDGATHYRVFDEPISGLQEIQGIVPAPEESLIQESPTASPESTSPVIEERVIITAYKPEVAPIQNISMSPPSDKEILTSLDTELMLTGIASAVMLHLMNNILDDNAGITIPIVIEDLQKQTSLNLTSIRKAIQRLEKKGIIERFRVKNGRRGWTQYKICNYSHLKSILHKSK